MYFDGSFGFDVTIQIAGVVTFDDIDSNLRVGIICFLYNGCNLRVFS